jgi:tetratricopeptide (TPR) repeat protein
VGRYADAFEVNELAAKADENYITQCRAQGIYPLNYYPHNVHFQAWAALMQGNSKTAITSARKVAAQVPEDFHGNDWALYQTFLSMPLYTFVRFGRWEAIMAEPSPPENLYFWQGIWHYARGMAFTHTSKLKQADEELAAVRDISRNSEAISELIGFGEAGTLLTIAAEVLAGELAAKQAGYDTAISHLERAVRLEDSLIYNEPPDWYYPVRHTLGAVLLEAGYPAEAEVIYWQDLRRYRDNGYSLYGLWQSFKSRGLKEDAARIKAQFQLAWADADVVLSSSRF